MADIKVRVGQSPAVKVTSSLGGAQGGSLAELSDVNITGTLQNGMVLVFNGATKITYFFVFSIKISLNCIKIVFSAKVLWRFVWPLPNGARIPASVSQCFQQMLPLHSPLLLLQWLI